MIRAGYHAVRVFLDPTRLDHVFAMAAALRTPAAVRGLLERFSQEEEGRRALAKRPRIAPLDLAPLRALPEGTLGRGYADYFDSNGVDPATFLTRPSRDDGEYVYAHLFESHDVWHVVTGFDTSLAGELGLQAFTLAQLHSRAASALLAAGMAHTAFFGFREHTARMDAITRGWAMGKACRPLLGVDWRSLFALPLARVRARYAITV